MAVMGAMEVALTRVPRYITAGLNEMGRPCCSAFFQLTVGWFTHTSIVPDRPPINAHTQPGRGRTAEDAGEAGEAGEGEAEEEGAVGIAN